MKAIKEGCLLPKINLCNSLGPGAKEFEYVGSGVTCRVKKNPCDMRTCFNAACSLPDSYMNVNTIRAEQRANKSVT